MTDFSDAHIAKCKRCGAVFCPEDGGCDCREEDREEWDWEGKIFEEQEEDE